MDSDVSPLVASAWATDPNRAANARLIAAAPELLEALTALRDELSGVDPWWGRLSEAADAADAAIAKATGQ